MSNHSRFKIILVCARNQPDPPPPPPPPPRSKLLKRPIKAKVEATIGLLF